MNRKKGMLIRNVMVDQFGDELRWAAEKFLHSIDADARFYCDDAMMNVRDVFHKDGTGAEMTSVPLFFMRKPGWSGAESLLNAKLCYAAAPVLPLWHHHGINSFCRHCSI